jgi:hypothetical protein
MKKLLFACAMISFALIAQTEKKVLWIGNSYTGANNLPMLTKNIANSFGDVFTYDSNTPGGNTFTMQSTNAVNFNKMHSNDWDVVVLQAQSQEPSFPHNQVSTSTYPAASVLNDSIQTILECAETMFYMTWGRETGDPQWDSIASFEKMNDRLINAYTFMANANDASVAPVALAWKYIRDNYPSIELYTSDGSHPSYAGSYLVASVFYATIFNKPVEDASFIGSLDASTASILRIAADSTVFQGDYAQWMNGSVNRAFFTSNQSGSVSFDFMNQSIGEGLTYKWLFGDGMESSEENPTHFFPDTGEYDVTLITYSPCGNDTTVNTIVLTLGIEDKAMLDVELFQIANGYQLTFSEGSNKTVELFNTNGQLIERLNVTFTSELTTSYKGVAILSVKNKEGIYFRQKLIF